MFDAPGDLLLLRAQPVGCEDRVGFRLAVAAQVVHQRRQFGVACAAVGAVGEMIRDGRIHDVAVALGQIRVEQPVIVNVVRARYHGCPPSRLRSLRTARNR